MKPVTGIVLLLLLIASRGALGGDDERPATVALPRIKVAASDELGRITVNGTPFFPIVMYDVPIDSESLKMFREHGFNVLSARADDAEVLRSHGFYAAAHGSTTPGLSLDGVLFGIGMDSPALNWKEDLLEKSRADLAAMQKSFPNRPIFHAIGYWADEPEGVFSNKLPAKERFEELIKVLDVSAPYLYPLPYQPVRSISEALSRADAAGGGRKPLLPILQLFVWKPEDRYPTSVELKCMVYQSLIHGADGIGYYSFNYVTGKQQSNLAREQPELWQSVRAINADAKQVGEFLLDSRPDSAVRVTANASVERRVAARGETILLLLANTAPVSRAVRVDWSSKQATLSRVGGGAAPVIDQGIAEWTLAPHESLGLLGER